MLNSQCCLTFGLLIAGTGNEGFCLMKILIGQKLVMAEFNQ